MQVIAPDNREEKSFEILRGNGETIFSYQKKVVDLTSGTDNPVNTKIGDPIFVYTGLDDLCNYIRPSARLLNTSSQTNSSSDLENHMVGLAWNPYDVSGKGDPDAINLEEIVVLGGDFIAKVKEDKFEADASILRTIPVFYNSSTQYNLLTTSGSNYDKFGKVFVGKDVVVIYDGTDFKYVAIPNDALRRYDGISAGNTTTDNGYFKVIDNAVIGKILKVENGFVTIYFHL